MTLSLSRPLRWIAGAFLALALLIALFVAFFDWNWVREPIARRVSAATGRSFAIRGDLKVHLSLHPRVVANDVVLGNAAWAKEPALAEVKQIDFTVDLLKLLAGHVDLAEITLSQPRLALEISPVGAVNWAFKEQPDAKPTEFPTIGRLAIDAGTATFRDTAHNTDLAVELKTLPGQADASTFGLALAGKGRYKGLPAVINARGGALLNLRDAQHPYPIQASGSVGGTRFSIDGTLIDPLHFKGEQLNFQIAGSDLALLFPLVGVPMPKTAAYQFAGFLDHTGDVWSFRRFKGKLGGSDLAGDISVDRGKKPQKLVATVASQVLILKDLAGFIGAKPGGAAGSPPRTRFLPAEPFQLDKLMAADVDVNFQGAKLVMDKLPLDKMKVHLIVNGGIVKLAPLDFGVAGGNLVSMIEMDSRQPRMVTQADITARGLRMDRMFSTSKLGSGGTGTMGGRAILKGNGNSVAQMLATANGDAALIMEGGSVGELALRMSNLDIANSLLLMLGGDKQAPVRCMVGAFNAVAGDFKVKSLVLDTAKVNVTGTGHVDFTDESLHLRLVSQSKGFSLASLRGPIGLTGTFMAPVLKPELEGALLRGGAAVALGVATGGIGALIPLLDFGSAKDSNCAALVSQAQQGAGVKPGPKVKQR